MSSPSAEPPAYEPKETAKYTTAVFMQSGVMGAIVGALQTSLSSETGNWWKKMYKSTGIFGARPFESHVSYLIVAYLLACLQPRWGVLSH